MGTGDSKCTQTMQSSRFSEIETNSYKNEVIQKMILRVQNQIERPNFQQNSYNNEKGNQNAQKNNNYDQQENQMTQNQRILQQKQQNLQNQQQPQQQQFQGLNYQQQQQQQQRILQQQQQFQQNVQQVNGRGYQVNGPYQQINIRVNCNIDEYLFSKLPSSVLYIILSFCLQEYIKIILVSPLWYYKIHDCIETELLKIDNDFIKRYSNNFLFKNSYLSIKPIKVNNHFGFRMDRNICAEVLPTINNKSVTIQYTNRSYRKLENNNVKLKKYLCEFHIDAIPKKNSRTIWAYKEDCKHNYDKKKVAFVQPIMPVKVGDNIKISVNFFNMNGLVNIYSIQWKDLVIQNIQSIPIQLNSNSIEKYEKERICETEEIYSDWILFEYFHNINKKKIDDFSPYLYLKEVYCAGVDIITSKHIYIAKQPSKGILARSKEKLGVNIQILDDNQEQICEVKRKGLYQDNESTIQLRLGDVFVFYISGGD